MRVPRPGKGRRSGLSLFKASSGGLGCDSPCAPVGLHWARVGGQRLDSRQCKHFPLVVVGGPASGGGRQVQGTCARLPSEQASEGMYGTRLPCTVCSMLVVFVLGLGWLGAAMWKACRFPSDLASRRQRGRRYPLYLQQGRKLPTAKARHTSPFSEQYQDGM